MKYKNVVWDWNGTLLNDVKVGVNTLNDMLGRRGLPLLSVEDYKEKVSKHLEYNVKKIAREVKKTGVSAKLDPMNSYERRIRFSGHRLL